MTRLLSRLLTVLLATALLGACGGELEPVETDLDAASVRFQRLQDDLRAVNVAQASTVGALRPALDAMATVDATIPRLMDGDTFDEGLARVPAARVAIDLVEFDGIRSQLLEIAQAVDEARVSLRRAAGVFDDPADVAYLDATDDVLVALHGLAAAQDALTQVAERHFVVYEDFVAAAEDFRERRNRFRNADEAADAFSVETRALLRDIAIAQEDIANFLEARDVAADQVARQQAVADEAFEARGEDIRRAESPSPSDAASSGPGSP